MSTSHPKKAELALSPEALRMRIATLGTQMPGKESFFTLDDGVIDAALGGGLKRGALHEITTGVADAPAGAGFALALARRATRTGPVFWLRQEAACREEGEVYGPGLAEFGLAPNRLTFLRLRTAVDILRAGAEAAHCAALAAVILEIHGDARAIDLTATRRLTLAAEKSGATLFLLRVGGNPGPSAAMTRWIIRSAVSAALEGKAPGHPVFEIGLRRHRAGLGEQTWFVEWDRDRCIFRKAALSRAVVSVPAGQPAAPCRPRDETLRRAG